MCKLIKLNFGCGRDIKKDYLNVDVSRLPGVDVVFNFNEFPYPLEDSQFEFVYSDNVIEHLDDITAVFRELHRIVCDGGLLHIIVPYYNCYGAYNDVTHRHYFSHRSFEPFYTHYTRSNYFIKEKYELVNLTLVPTRFGKLVPKCLRLPLSFVLGQVIQTIDIKLKVVK